uniref:Uncharacterized protein n=1 Tax=Rhabditophanes sp. KR3021 TaxID=114890 RepID=A0AC35U042_9BILA
MISCKPHGDRKKEIVIEEEKLPMNDNYNYVIIEKKELARGIFVDRIIYKAPPSTDIEVDITETSIDSDEKPQTHHQTKKHSSHKIFKHHPRSGKIVVKSVEEDSSESF